MFSKALETLSGLFLVVLGIGFLTIAFMTIRTDNILVVGDAQFNSQSPTFSWDILYHPFYFLTLDIPYKDKANEAIQLRKAATLLTAGKNKEALEMLEPLGNAKDSVLASKALTLQGKLIADEGIYAKNPDLMKKAAELFARAVKLDPSNEDAKYDLELLLDVSAMGGTPLSPGDLEGPPKPGPPQQGAGGNPPFTSY